MNTTQKSVTLGLLKLTLNKLIYCHSSIRNPVLSTLQLHPSSASQQSSVHGQSSGVTWHCQKTGNGAPEHTFTTACQVLSGQDRVAQEPAAFYQLSQWDSCTGDTHHNTGKLLMSWGSSAFSLLSLNELSL